MRHKTTQFLVKKFILALSIFLLHGKAFSQCHDLSAVAMSNGFETTDDQTGWQTEDANADGTIWGIVPTYPNNGAQCMRLFVNSTAANNADDWLFTKCITMNTGKTYRLQFYYRNINPASYDGSLEVSLSNLQSSSGTMQSIVNLGSLENSSYLFSTNDFTVSASGDYYIAFHATNNTSVAVSIRIDDYLLTEVANQDAGVTEVNLPGVNGCTLSATEEVVVTIKNYGAASISNFNVSYSINGNAPVTENVSSAIQPDSSMVYTFAVKADLSALNTYNIAAYTSVSGDSYVWNDSSKAGASSVAPHNFNTSNLTNGFETTQDTTAWKVKDANNDGETWRINTANTNTGGACLRLGSSATVNSDDWYFTRCMDLVAGETYRVNFYYRPWNNDAQKLEVKLGNAQNAAGMNQLIIDLGTVTGTGVYNLVSAGFTVAVSGTYYVGFHGYSDPGGTSQRIDDINIYKAAALDAGMVNIVAPVTGTCSLPNNASINAVIKNYGTTAISNFNVSYTVNGLTPVTENVPSSIAPDSTLNYTFSAPADLSAKGQYNIAVYTSLTGDGGTWNDTVSTSVTSIVNDLSIAPFTAGFETSEDFSGWNVIDNNGVNGDGYTWAFGNDTAYANTGSGFVFYDSTETNDADDWLFTPCLTLNASKAYVLTFSYRTDNPTAFANDFEIKTGTDQTIAAMTQSVLIMTSAYSPTYVDTSVTFTVASGGTYYVGFHVTSIAAQSYLLIDDIRIQEITGLPDGTRAEFEVHAYPNPSSGKLMITTSLPVKNKMEVEVTNMIGQTLATHHFNNAHIAMLDLSGQENGIYFIKIKTGEEMITRKVILSR